MEALANRRNQPTVVDLFAGVGGMSLGFDMAGCSVLGAVEHVDEMAQCYKKNHRGRRPMVLAKDASQVGPSHFRKLLGLRRDELTFLVGGPPCQGFSTMGKRRHGDARNDLLMLFPEYLSEFRSEAFVIENVPGLLSFQNGQVLDQLVNRLVHLGYADTRVSTVNAADCGVPQNRKRVVVYGSRAGRLPDLSQVLCDKNGRVTVLDAIADLPDAISTALTNERGMPAEYGPSKPSAYARRLRGGARFVTRWEPTVHSDRVLGFYRAIGQGQVDRATGCRRLESNGLAPTLRAGSSTRTACRPVHPTEHRVITVREAARIHSFPDYCQFPVTTASAHVAIGNAVPPLMAQAIAATLMCALEGSPEAT